MICWSDHSEHHILDCSINRHNIQFCIAENFVAIIHTVIIQLVLVYILIMHELKVFLWLCFFLNKTEAGIV